MTQPRIGRPQPSRSTDDVLAMIDDAVDTPFQVGIQHAGDDSYGVAIDAGLCWRCLQGDADPASPAELCTSCSSEVAAEEYVAPAEDPPDVAAIRRSYRPSWVEFTRIEPAGWPAVEIQWPAHHQGLFRIMWTSPVDVPFAGLELTLFPRVGAAERWARRIPARARVRVQLGVMAFARWLLRKAGETPPPATPAPPPRVHTVIGGRQTGRTYAAAQAVMLETLAATLGVPPELVGAHGRAAAGPLIIDDPPHRPEARSAMRQVLAQHYAREPLCHAYVDRDGVLHQVTRSAPDQEDTPDA